jgi:signal transduction histidine kinase
MKHYIYRQFLQPLNSDQDTQRREFILNVLLLGLLTVAVVAFGIGVASFTFGTVVHGEASIVTITAFLAVIVCLQRLVRLGRHHLSTYSLLILIFLLYFWLSWQWSFELPMAILIFTIMLFMAGILLPARAALQFAAAAIALSLVFSYLQVIHVLHPHTSWIDEPVIMGDAVGYAIIFGIISLVSWLANREIDRSLQRARISEAALAKERDSLELKVTERTQELEQIQLVRLMELQRLAEFGRFSANLLHEIGNPVTAASLNLEQVRHHPQSELVLQARKSLQHLERYLTTARKQLKGQGELAVFSIHHELNQLVDILLPNARNNNVTIELREAGSYQLYGDAVKFNQLLSNLILNAIEAYNPQSSTGSRDLIIVIAVTRQSQKIIITIRDHGAGIASRALPYIFEPFYSTKPDSSRSMGIGLAMVKQFVEQDFHGTITVTSSPKAGTVFTVSLPNKRPLRP